MNTQRDLNNNNYPKSICFNLYLHCQYQLLRLKNTAAKTIKPKSAKGTHRLGTSDKLIFNYELRITNYKLF